MTEEKNAGIYSLIGKRPKFDIPNSGQKASLVHSMTSTIAHVAQTGFANASSYDRHRPSYPLEAVENILRHLRIEGVQGARIVDLGAGTGKFTELLAERKEDFEILAIEPHEAMREELERKSLKGVSIIAGDAANMPLESQSVDAVIATQVALPLSHSVNSRIKVLASVPVTLVAEDSCYTGFPLVCHSWRCLPEIHARRSWKLNFGDARFANDDSLKEIYRVLQPSGVFAMIWNTEDCLCILVSTIEPRFHLESSLHSVSDQLTDNAPQSWNPTTTWEGKIKAITWRLDDQHPRFRHEQWREVFEKQLSTTPFTIHAADPLFSLPVGEESVKFTYWLSKEAVWERYSTLSQIAVLEPAEKDVSITLKPILPNLSRTLELDCGPPNFVSSAQPSLIECIVAEAN